MSRSLQTLRDGSARNWYNMHCPCIISSIEPETTLTIHFAKVVKLKLSHQTKAKTLRQWQVTVLIFDVTLVVFHPCVKSTQRTSWLGGNTPLSLGRKGKFAPSKKPFLPPAWYMERVQSSSMVLWRSLSHYTDWLLGKAGQKQHRSWKDFYSWQIAIPFIFPICLPGLQRLADCQGQTPTDLILHALKTFFCIMHACLSVEIVWILFHRRFVQSCCCNYKLPSSEFF